VHEMCTFVPEYRPRRQHQRARTARFTTSSRSAFQSSSRSRTQRSWRFVRAYRKVDTLWQETRRPTSPRAARR